MTKDTFTTKDVIIRMDDFHEQNRERHESLMKEIAGIKAVTAATNGKVKLHQKILWSLGGVLIMVFTMLFNHISG